MTLVLILNQNLKWRLLFQDNVKKLWQTLQWLGLRNEICYIFSDSIVMQNRTAHFSIATSFSFILHCLKVDEGTTWPNHCVANGWNGTTISEPEKNKLYANFITEIVTAQWAISKPIFTSFLTEMRERIKKKLVIKM